MKIKFKKKEKKLQIKFNLYMWIYLFCTIFGLIEGTFQGMPLQGLVAGFLISVSLSFFTLICLIPVIGFPLYLFIFGPSANGFISSLLGVNTPVAYGTAFIVFGLFGCIMWVVTTIAGIALLSILIGGISKWIRRK